MLLLLPLAAAAAAAVEVEILVLAWGMKWRIRATSFWAGAQFHGGALPRVVCLVIWTLGEFELLQQQLSGFIPSFTYHQ